MNAPTKEQLPPTPKPVRFAVFEGVAMQGSEIRRLADNSYEPGCAEYSHEQMQAYAIASIRSYIETQPAPSQPAQEPVATVQIAEGETPTFRFIDGYGVDWMQSHIGTHRLYTSPQPAPAPVARQLSAEDRELLAQAEEITSDFLNANIHTMPTAHPLSRRTVLLLDQIRARLAADEGKLG